MRRQHSIFGALMIASAIGAAAAIGSAPATQSRGPIPLLEVNERGIQGLLGTPLGTIVTVSADVVPNDSREKRYADETFLLRIRSVDGKSLPRAVDYPFRKAPLAHVGRPKVGQKFNGRGYESGACEGVLTYRDGLNRGSVPAAGLAFGFYTQFCVLSSE